MHDRGMIKWAPFNSVINENEVIKEVSERKSRISKPTLSDDQLADIEQKIINAYNENQNVTLTYYTNFHLEEISGQISKIDPINKRIFINNQIPIYFYNIIKIL